MPSLACYKFWTPSGDFQKNLMEKLWTEPGLEPEQKSHKKYLGVRFTNEATVTVLLKH